MSTDDRISIEDRVRIATQARASLVRDLRSLPAPEPAPLRHRSTPRSRRWLTWGVPVAAAAAVVAIALSLVAIRQHDAVPGKPSPPVTGSADIPRYYVALKLVGTTSGATTLIIGDDRAGTAIATVPAPRGVTFSGVEGTADNRTFLVTAVHRSDTQQDNESVWYLLRLAPGTAHPYQLTKRPGGFNPNMSFALSPDGTELVEELPGLKVTKLSVISVASGKALRTWTTNTNIMSAPALNVSWLSDGRHVAFNAVHSTSVQVRTLDVTAPGADLLAASRVLVTIPLSGPDTCYSAQATPDGRSVLCATQYNFLTGGGSAVGCATHGPRFVVYSVRTGKPVRVLYQYPGPCTSGLANVLWMDPSASHVIGEVQYPDASGMMGIRLLGVTTKAGGFQAIKLPKAVTPADFASIAF